MPNHLCPRCQTGPRTPYRRLDPYPSVTRPAGVLTIDGFAYIQRRSAVVMLHQLLHGCWQAYRNALLLTRPGALLPDLFDRYPRLDRPEWVRMILEVLGYLPATTRDPDILLEDEPLFAAACFDTIINANQETIDAY